MRRALALSAATLLLASACDWDYYSLMNSIPVEGDPAANPVIHVVLGIDGVPIDAASEAVARGAFPGWHMARHVTSFPGTSDVAWSRILHTTPVESYEYQYYDPQKHELVRNGYTGLLAHTIPLTEKPCYRAFDFSGNGLTNGYYNYRAPQYSLGTTLDNIFTLLEGRVQSRSTKAFLGFIIETDVIGHMQTREDFVAALEVIDRRIELFKAAHPERTWLFTLVSDHGHNFVASPDDKMIRFQNELPKVGVEVVDTLADRGPDSPLAAIPIVHTRVTYLSLNTVQEQAPEVAKRVSTFEFVDLAIAKIPAPEGARPEGLAWYAIWKGGELALAFGHDSATDRYHVLPGGDPAALEMGWLLEESAEGLSDEMLFARTLESVYPDLLYKTRTALEPVGIRFPAQVLVSFAQPFASVGFEVPGGANEVATSSFHGAMHRKDSLGVVLTEERDLPPAFRSDNFLEFFPAVRRHLESRLSLSPSVDANESLDYAQVFP